MKRSLFCLLVTTLVWTWSPPIVRATDPTTPIVTPQNLYDVSWPPRSCDTGCCGSGCSASPSQRADLADRDPFSKGSCTLQFMVGYFPKTEYGPGGPDFDYLPFAARVGYICDTPDWDGCWLRGCFELLLEVNYCRIMKDFGNYVTGPNAMIRYNFVQPQSILIPYIQAGAGLAFTDAYKAPESVQELIGQQMEFLLRAELGARLMVTENCSLDAEFGLQHISNATLAPRNGGVNNVGFSLGFTYFFGKVK